jgi:hypothetical protein
VIRYKKKKKGEQIFMGGKVSYLRYQFFALKFGIQGCGGGGKCPEEEHTTCSGGPTINCHKRGLRGERKYYYFRERK